MTNKELQDLLKQYPDGLEVTIDTPYCWHTIKKVFLFTHNNSEPEIIIRAEE